MVEENVMSESSLFIITRLENCSQLTVEEFVVFGGGLHVVGVLAEVKGHEGAVVFLGLRVSLGSGVSAKCSQGSVGGCSADRVRFILTIHFNMLIENVQVPCAPFSSVVDAGTNERTRIYGQEGQRVEWWRIILRIPNPSIRKKLWLGSGK